MLSSRVIGGTWIGIGIAGACAVLALATSWVPGFEVFGPSAYRFDATLAASLLTALGLSAFVGWSGYRLYHELTRAGVVIQWVSAAWLLVSCNLIVFASEVAGHTAWGPGGCRPDLGRSSVLHLLHRRDEPGVASNKGIERTASALD